MELHTPGGERGETGAPQGLSHAFTHGSRCTSITPAPAKEVSIAPCATGLGPFPKGTPSSLLLLLLHAALVSEAGKIDASRCFGMRVCGAGAGGALLLTPHPAGACVPALQQCQSWAQQRQCSTPAPGAPDPAPEWQSDQKSHLGEGLMKAKVFKAEHEAIMFVQTLPCLCHRWNPGAGSYVCAFPYLLSLSLSPSSSNSLFLDYFE